MKLLRLSNDTEAKSMWVQVDSISSMSAMETTWCCTKPLETWSLDYDKITLN